MMIEQNTNYAYKLKYMDNPTFDKVRDLSTKFYRELPQALQDELFEALNRGIDILDSEPQMTAYLFAFGKMHQAKLNYAFGKLPKEFLEQPEINIIDYGCGQALGTMCYADFLRENGYAQKVNTITLIEPSEICLKRAALHASVFFPDSEIKTVNKKFDNLDEGDIICSEETPTLHIFSNVLDVLDFDLEGFAGLIKGQIKGFNQFACIGPFFNFSVKDNRMIQFHLLIGGKEEYRIILDKYELDSARAWTVQVLCFSIGVIDENLSTKVTYEDRVNDVQDGRGMYNKDGSKLLCCLNPKNGQLDTFTIKQGTKIICDEAFSSDDCKLKQVNIPESVTHIGDKAFEDCRYLEQIDIPESVISIGNLVFKGCWKLKQITIPHSIKQIGDNPFVAPCLLFSNSDRFIINNEMLIDLYEKRLISYFGKGKEVVIPEIVTKIGNYAFYDCDSIERIIIPHKIKSIGDYAFSHSSLQSFCITESIEHIGKNPFEACGVVEELMPWEDPTKRPSVNITSNSGRFIVVKGMIIDKMQNKLIAYFENESMVSIPDDVTTICDSAFSGCISVEQITIPDSVTSIGDSAFEYTSIEQISIPNSVTSIGREAFGGCEQLNQINLPNGISTIEEGTFDYCTNLRQITIPNTVKSIGKCAFASCPLTQIKLPKSIEFIGWRIFQGCHSLERIIIPKGTREKFSELFYNGLDYIDDLFLEQ